MAGLTEVPTEELLNFHDFPTTHTSGPPINENFQGAKINVDDLQKENSSGFPGRNDDGLNPLEEGAEAPQPSKSFWTLEYYQQFFDVDTKDVLDRIIASVIPLRTNTLRAQIKQRPDLYGPLWVSITLIFTIAISGNIANYLQHANEEYHWRYDFHLVSYAATTIFLYISIVPMALWALLKWSSDINDLEGLEPNVAPKALELICIYGYSLFVYIPASILWTIQVGWLQWLLVIVAACVSGCVLMFTLLPSFKLSRHKIFLLVGAISCHALLAAGFMLYFFHGSDSGTDQVKEIVKNIPVEMVTHAGTVVTSIKSTV